MKIRTAFDSFILAKLADGLSENTIKWYKSELAPLLDKFADIEAIQPDDLRAHIVEIRQKDRRYVGAVQRPEISGGLSYASMSAHIRAMHAFFSWCAAEYDIPNPMRNIKRPKHVQPAPKAVHMSDFVKLFNATSEGVAGTRDRAILAFIADTGCRLGGLLSLTLENLDIARHNATVTEKGNKQRVVYFTHFTAQLLYLYLGERRSHSKYVFVSVSTGEGLTASGIAQLLKRLKKRAGVSGRVNPHSFRHNFARSYIENGGDISTLAKILGHSDINTTAAYYAVFTKNELATMHRKFTPMAHIDLSSLFDQHEEQ